MDTRKLRVLRLAGAAVLLVAVTSGPAPSTVTLADESMVHMLDNCTGNDCQYSFWPRDLTLPAGSGITFMNLSSVAHTATSDTGSFDTGTMAPGGIVRIEFDSPGTFLYHCTIHPSMQGRIVITGSGPTATVPVPTATATTLATPTATAPIAAPTATSPAETVRPTQTARPKLTLSARFVPKSVRRGQAMQLRVRTLPAARLSIVVNGPGMGSVKRSATANARGAYALKVSTEGKGKAGAVVGRVTARAGQRSMTTVARGIIRNG